MISLTSTGRQVAENTQGRGPEYAVLSHLYESGGTMEVEEIMDATNMDIDRARMILNDLLHRGLIKEV